MENQIDINDYAYASTRFGSLSEPTPCPVDEKTGKINPHVSRFKNSEGKTVSVFHVKPVYYETVEHTWRPLYEVTVHYGNHHIVFDYAKVSQVHPRFIEWLTKRCGLIGGSVSVSSPFTEKVFAYNSFVNSIHRMVSKPTIGLTTTTVYPDPHTESTSVDGGVGSYGAGTTWANLHDSGDPSVYPNPWISDSGTTTDIVTDNNSGFRVIRGIFLFDTSSIPDGDTIDTADASFYGHTDKANTPAQSIGLVQSSPASNTAIVYGDYDGFTVHSDTVGATAITIASWSTAGYNTFSMNATGKGWISKTGVTKLGLRASIDYNETASHSSGPGTFSSYVRVRCADQTGTSEDPKLVVVHTDTGSPTITPAVLTATFSLPSRTITTDLQFYTISATFTIPTYTITAQRNVSTSLGLLSARFTTPQEFISGGFWNDKYQGVTKTWFDKF